MTMRPLALAALVALAGCPDAPVETDASAPSDGGVELGAEPDGGPPLSAGFSVIGCATLTYPSGQPRCTGLAPLVVTFVPLGSGVNTFLWSFSGANLTTSMAIAPSVTFAQPGTYAVTLTAGGLQGSTAASGTIVVGTGGLGAACSDTTECDPSTHLTCLCSGGDCPGALQVGLCSSDCTSGCGTGVCADLTRGGTDFVPDGGLGDGGDDGDEWRRALCLASCATSADCRTGLVCREVPALAAGVPAGGAFTWQPACFADFPGDVGDSCFDASGAPSGAACLSGRCDAFGARGLCTADCGASGGSCPSAASCATFNGTPSSSECLLRCDATHLCADPLLDCEPAGKAGALGFTVAAGDPAGTTYCAPRRCTQPSDCAPAGACTVMGAGSFCVRN
jgi:PKD repeat protein